LRAQAFRLWLLSCKPFPGRLFVSASISAFSSPLAEKYLIRNREEKDRGRVQ
jgi:hypothetical protein